MNIVPDNADAATTYIIMAVVALIFGAIGAIWWPVGTVIGAVLGVAIGYGLVSLLSATLNIQ